jgi:hypothetical protein
MCYVGYSRDMHFHLAGCSMVAQQSGSDEVVVHSYAQHALPKSATF